ncbi:MAG: class I SAM-dependent methyltransferase [Alphaproteobacteria bacterium]
MDTEKKVAAHYTHGALEQTILGTLRAAGKDIEKLTATDLSAVDEFHLGWRDATIEFAKDLRLATGARVLDIGAGIGGPARYFAEARGCQVTGIDLTPEFVQAANALTRRCGLSDKVEFREASATGLMFDDGAFDTATMIHVGMNIPDKAKVFAEARRVLKPGGKFGVYDIMRAGDGEIPYPMPWAGTRDTSFLETPATYQRLLAHAGFEIESETDRSAFVRDLVQKRRAQAEKESPSPLGIHILGPDMKERLANVMRALQGGLIAPTQIIARAV